MKKYLAIFKINLLNSLAYPAEVTTRSGMILIFISTFRAGKCTRPLNPSRMKPRKKDTLEPTRTSRPLCMPTVS